MITSNQIKAFRKEASTAGDRVACAVCDIALGIKCDTATLRKLELTRETARALVAEWITRGG